MQLHLDTICLFDNRYMHYLYWYHFKNIFNEILIKNVRRIWTTNFARTRSRHISLQNLIYHSIIALDFSTVLQADEKLADLADRLLVEEWVEGCGWATALGDYDLLLTIEDWTMGYRFIRRYLFATGWLSKYHVVHQMSTFSKSVNICTYYCPIN